MVREELRQRDVQSGIVITVDELEENMPREAIEPVLDLTITDYRGKEADPIINQAYDNFVSNDDFVKPRVFKQILWRIHMQIFEAKCRKIKIEQSNKEDSDRKEEIKGNLLEDFDNITPEASR